MLTVPARETMVPLFYPTLNQSVVTSPTYLDWSEGGSGLARFARNRKDPYLSHNGSKLATFPRHLAAPCINLDPRQPMELLLPGGVAFTGEGKLVRKATGYEHKRLNSSGIGSAGCATPSSRPPFERYP